MHQGNPHEKLQAASTDRDLLPVVDEHDQPIAVLPRREVHLRELRHRAVHVCVFDRAGRLWLQLRSRSKDAWGGYWDLSATGHVDPHESYDEAAARELREELGMEGTPQYLVKLEATRERCWEFHALYYMTWDGTIDRFNRDEIERMQPFSREELASALSPSAGESSTEHPMCPSIPDALPYLDEIFDALATGTSPTFVPGAQVKPDRR